jgi:hypothetical protein
MATHAIAVQGPGGTTAAAKTQIGSNITLPAGGPWIIHNLWGQVVKATTLPAEGTGGQLIIDALSGDLSPDPAPGKYPLPGNPGTSSANSSSAAVPLHIWDVLWGAAGKAVITLSYLQQLAITTASEVAAGIIFGDSVPPKLPLVFCDGVYASFASASEQTIGTITLSEKASRIVGIFADINKGDALTTAEEVLATIRLASDDVKMPPAQYPCMRAFDAGDGTVEGETACPKMEFIPVDIPITGGARISCYATTSISVTGNADVQVFLAYE